MGGEILKKGFLALVNMAGILSAFYFALNVFYSPGISLKTNRPITVHGEWFDLVYYIGFFAFTYYAYWSGKSIGKKEIYKKWEESIYSKQNPK